VLLLVLVLVLLVLHELSTCCSCMAINRSHSCCHPFLHEPSLLLCLLLDTATAGLLCAYTTATAGLLCAYTTATASLLCAYTTATASLLCACTTAPAAPDGLFRLNVHTRTHGTARMLFLESRNSIPAR